MKKGKPMEYKKLKNNYDCDVKIEHNIGANWIMDYYHFHNVYEIYLAVTEGAEIWVRDQRYILEPNDLILFSTNDLHRSIIHDKSNYERYILYFNPLYASTMNTSQTNLLQCFLDCKEGFSYRIHLENKQTFELIEMFKSLNNMITIEKKAFAVDVKIKIFLTEILIFINEIFHSKKTIFDSSEIEHSGYNIIKPILDYLDIHYYENISTDFVSSYFKINRHELNALFRDITGLTFHQYLVSIRIIKARELLEGGSISITQVCYESGFNDYAHFIRTFKAMVGSSPGSYAKNYKV